MAEPGSNGAKRVWAVLGLLVLIVAMLAFLAGPQRLWPGFASTPATPDPARPTSRSAP